ncbi:sensor histidine kinase [Duganella radicis]|uniref:histidine kinase n=1 Tax=Duganella radicis TaxID=551988 RepID=A0A6L6PLZ5_9BURK|nr:HAMP domain-containing sensor histidine kinase [Duganella radicis]MTV40140.1 sensor histidine kinase [Duganella radicis]
MSESEVPLSVAPGDVHDAEAQFHVLREYAMAHELTHLASTLQQLAPSRLNASQALELQAFQLLRRAAELYERCGLPALAVQTRAARCRVMLSAEMHEELHALCDDMLSAPDMLTPAIHTMLLDYSASSSYYMALENIDRPEAEPHWRDCMARRMQVLDMARTHRLRSQECLALLNLSVVCAAREQAGDCRHYMRQLHHQFGHDGYWEPWLELCSLLIQCVDGEREPAWQALLDYDAWLESDALHTSRLRDLSLMAIRRYGRRWGHLDRALQACMTQVANERRHKRELTNSLGATLNAVMERPQLLHQNALLAQHGTVLENSLMQRNQELREAHDELEQKVRERSAELSQALQSLMRQEKQLSLSRMVAGMAHELNTPLGNARVAASAITEQAEQLRRDLTANSLRRSQLSGLLDSVTQGGDLVERALLQISELVERFKGLSVHPSQESACYFDLSERLHFFRNSWAHTLKSRSISIRVVTPEHLWMTGYPGACQLVFQHLLDNCMQHAFTDRKQGAILVSAEVVGGMVLIRWEDDGCGIAAEHLAQVFDPFYTTQLGQTGMGLGLASVHSMMINLMQGQVSLDSTPGHGTRVLLRLPT